MFCDPSWSFLTVLMLQFVYWCFLTLLETSWHILRLPYIAWFFIHRIQCHLPMGGNPYGLPSEIRPDSSWLFLSLPDVSWGLLRLPGASWLLLNCLTLHDDSLHFLMLTVACWLLHTPPDYFSPNRALGRFGLVVAMSVPLSFVCL